jgi:DNA-binding transcriptional regulator PaaX
LIGLMKMPLTRLVLSIIADMGDSAVELTHLISAISTRYGNAYRRGGYGYVAELRRLQNDGELKRIVRDLKHNKFIAAAKVGQRFTLSLTKKGEAVILANRLKNANKHKQGFYTVIIFDVPVSHSSIRRQFRELIRQGGFSMLQRSVWISRADVYDLVAQYVKQFRLQSWVNLFRATDLFHIPK